MGTMGADGLDFHPGLRVAYVEYCKLPVGQGRLTFDPSAPKMSQTQFIKLLQDIGVAEPEGPVPISTISIIFSSFKPLGATRMLFPHFFRALGAVGADAKVDVHRIVAHLGSRSVDLQYLSSIKIFPNKAYPYILTRGGGDVGAAPAPQAQAEPSLQMNDDMMLNSPGYNNRSGNNRSQVYGGAGRPVSATEGFNTRPGGVVAPGQLGAVPSSGNNASTAALRATHIARYAAAPFGGQAVVSKELSQVPTAGTPREAWQKEQFLQQQQQQQHPPQLQPPGPGTHYPQGPDSPSNIGVTVYHVGLRNGGNGNENQRQVIDSDSESPFPPNHHHMEQWGVWEPPKGPDGKVPGWINYMLNRMDRLEEEVAEARKSAASAALAAAQSAGGAAPAMTGSVTVAVDGFVTHETMRMHLEKVQEQIQGVESKAADLAVSKAMSAVGDVVKPVLARCTGLEGGVMELGEKLDGTIERVGTMSEKVDSELSETREKFESDMERLVGMVLAGSETLTTVAETTVPELEGAMTELAAQLLDLQGRLEKASNNDAVQAQIKRIVDDAAVDRTQLLTTTSLMDNYTTKTEQLKDQLVAIEGQLRSGGGGGGGGGGGDAAKVREALDRLEAADTSRAAEVHELRDTIASLRDELRAKAASPTSDTSSSSAAMQDLQQSLSGRIQQVETRVGSNDTPSSLQEAVKAMQEQFERNLKTLTDEAALDRTQQVATNNTMTHVLKSVDNLKPDVEKLQAQVEGLTRELQARSEGLIVSGGTTKAGSSSDGSSPVADGKTGSEGPAGARAAAAAAAAAGLSAGGDMADRIKACEERLQELEAVVASSGEPISRASSTMFRLRGGAAAGGDAAARNPSNSGDIEAVLDLAAALEEKFNTLDRLVRGNNAAISALEGAQSAGSARIAALESGGSGGGARRTSSGGDAAGGGSGRLGGSGGAAGGDVAALAKALGMTPEGLQSLAQKMEAVGQLEQSCQENQSEVLKVKLSFKGLQELLDNHSERLEHLEAGSDNVKAALEQFRIMELNEKMKLLNGNTSVNDDTVASQSELTALTAKVQNMEDTLIQTLVRMDSNIAQTAVRAVQGSLSGEANKPGMDRIKLNLANSGSGPLGSGRLSLGGPQGSDDVDRPSKGPHGNLIAVDGHIAGGMTDKGSGQLKSFNPQRDKLAAALMETDSKVSSMDEVVKSLKSGQDTIKGRIKDLAEALVALSNKAQVRLTKLESITQRNSESGGAEAEGDRRTSVAGQGVSAAHKALDQGSSQMTGMNRMLAKRLDDLEERLNKTSAHAPRLDGATQGGSSLEDDVRGLGHDVVALHGMMQRSEAALRQAIQEDCVSRQDMSEFQQSLETNLEQKEKDIAKLAQQIDEINSNL